MNRNALISLALALAPIAAFAQSAGTLVGASTSPGAPAITAATVNSQFTAKANVTNGTLTNPTITNGTITGADASGSTATATGSTTARTLAKRSAERINVKDYGAFGDLKTDNVATVTIGAGSAALTVSQPDFVAGDVGKHIVIDGAGVQATTGQITATPVTSAGSGYTTTPTVTFANTGGGSGVSAVANMALQTATVATGGAGCTDGAQTFTLTGGTIGTTGLAATVSGTVSGGVLGGALTVTPGSYLPGTLTTTLLAAATASVTGGGCATAPTITPSWGVGTITMAGWGVNYPAAGVTASLSGGTATLGTPTVTLPIAPLATTISGYTSATQVTLAAPATTAVSSAKQIKWGHLDDVGFQAAWAAATTVFAAGSPPVIYMPTGTYWISQALPTLYHVPVTILGEGRFRTSIHLDPTYSGPAFSISESWLGGGAYPGTGPTASTSISYAGSAFIGFTLVGDMTAPQEQDGIILYDRNDNVTIRDVYMTYLPGRGIFAGGALKNTTQAYMRESRFDEVYFAQVGGVGLPVIEMNSIGSGDSTNTNTWTNINMWDTLGPGVVIRNQNTIKPTSIFKIFGLRIEGGQAGMTGDGLQIGDPTQTGAVSNIQAYGLQVIARSGVSSGISVYAASSTYQPYGITLAGAIESVSGVGINLQSGRTSQFAMSGIQSNSYNIATGGSIGQFNQISAYGYESSLTYNNTVSGSLVTPTSSNIVPSTAGFTVNVHDGTALGGNTLGTGAVDLSTTRTSAGQVAGAQNSAILGGSGNTITSTGVNSAILNGTLNTASGTLSVLSGTGATDNANYGWNCYSTGVIAAPGDTEGCFTHLRGTGSSTTAIRVTATGGAANSTNCVNLYSAGIGAAMTLEIKLTAVNFTNPANTYSWIEPQGLLIRPGAVGTTAYSHGTPTILSTGTGSGASVSETADTGNGCLNLSFTPPAANTDTWHVGARVTFARQE